MTFFLTLAVTACFVAWILLPAIADFIRAVRR